MPQSNSDKNVDRICTARFAGILIFFKKALDATLGL